MTGWRLGWAVLPDSLVRPVECLAQSLFISPPTLSQLAALAAFDAQAELDAKVALYRRNRNLLIRRLPEAGIDRFLRTSTGSHGDTGLSVGRFSPIRIYCPDAAPRIDGGVQDMEPGGILEDVAAAGTNGGA